VLSDDVYRLVIKAKIAHNHWDGTLEQMTEIWSTLFPNIYLVPMDNQDMTMNALVIGVSSQLEQDLVTHGLIIPKPEAVHITYAYPENAAFAYGLENEVFKGYGEGYWTEYF
jgi:hypothetical protein